jgi:uncharacterized delta-60 repeat protein
MTVEATRGRLLRYAVSVGCVVVGVSLGGAEGRAGACPCIPYLPGLQLATGGLAPSLGLGVIGADGTGRVVSAGISSGHGSTKLVVVRYRPDGSLDPAFGYGGVTFAPASMDELDAIALYPDGRVIVAGSSNSGAAVLTRLAADGSVDTSFGNGGTTRSQVGTNHAKVLALDPLADGSVVVAGGAPATNGNATMMALRYRADGSLDSAFGRAGVTLLPVPEQPPDISAEVLAAAFDAQGRIVLSGVEPLPTPEGQNLREGSFVTRLRADGSLDTSFGKAGVVVGTDNTIASSLAIRPDDSIAFAGETSSGEVTVTRLGADGSSGGTVSLGAFPGGVDQPRLAAVPDGSVGVFVGTGVENTVAVGELLRLRADGTRDPSFDVHLHRALALVGLPDDSFVTLDFPLPPVTGLTRIRPDGSRDSAFVTHPPTAEPSGADALALDGDNAITAGWGQHAGRRFVELARFLRPQGGALDPSFGSGGIVDTTVGSGDSEAMTIARVPSGGYIAAGDASGNMLLLRYAASGALDVSFGSGGIVLGPPGVARSLALQSDGSILVAGTFGLLRYLSDGGPDGSFAGSSVPLTAVALQPDGRIVAAGSRDGSFAVYRFLPDGSPDPSFAAAGGPPGTAKAVSLARDGRIVVAGSGWAVARYSPSGAPDDSFGIGGVAVPPVEPGDANAVALQADGKVVVGGSAGGLFTLARLDEFGYDDTVFGSNYGEHGFHGYTPGADAAVAVNDGMIVAAGTDSEYGTSSSRVIWTVQDGATAPHAGQPLLAIRGTHMRRITHDGVTGPVLSPDRKTIAYIDDPDGVPDVYVVSVRGGTPRRLTMSPFGTDVAAQGQLAWSPDGKTIAFDAVGHVADRHCRQDCLRNDVYVVGADGGGLRRLITGGSSASWSADGKYLAYLGWFASNKTALLLVARANGGAPRRLAMTASPPVWSPLGDLVAYGTSNGFAVRRASGALVRQFVGFGAQAWAPDGRRLAAFGNYDGASDTTKVEILSLSGAPPQVVMGGYGLAAPSWSPDGRRLALFATRQNAWALVVRDVRTGRLLRRLYVGQHFAPPMWAADGTTIYIGG